MTKEERLDKDRAVDPIFFFGTTGEYGWCSNFAKIPVVMFQPFTGELVYYLTREHRFQAMKATSFADHEYVRNQPTAWESKDAGRSILLRDGWGNNYGDLCWYVMYETLLESATQESTIYNGLKKSIGQTMYENSPVDDIWGWRYQNIYSGKNLLGICWMEVRRVLFEERTI